MALSYRQKKERLEMAARFENSSLGQRAFCREEKISVSTLGHWRKQLKQMGEQTSDSGSFLEVLFDEGADLVEGVGPGLDLEIELPFGVELRLFGVVQGGLK